MVLNGASAITPLIPPPRNTVFAGFGSLDNGSPYVPTPVADKIHRQKMYNRAFTKKFTRAKTNFDQDLQGLRFGLFWMALDQSTGCQTLFSWLLFILLAVVIPVFEIVWIQCENCKWYNITENMSSSLLCALSFFILSSVLRTHGLRKLLMLHKLKKERREVLLGYTERVDHAVHLLSTIVLPLLLLEAPIRLWWFSKTSFDIPGIQLGQNEVVILWIPSMVAWTYKTGMYLVMCVLFSLMCSLQTLRLDGFLNMLSETKDAPILLAEYMQIRHQLNKISERGRLFLTLSLLTTTATQAVSLMLLLSSPENLNFLKASGLFINSAVQISGLFLCLNGATSISHKAYGIVAAVCEWHAIEACDTPSEEFPYGPIEFSRGQALVTYMKLNMSGISIYGYILDRGTLYGVFVIEFTLILFILGQTVGRLL